MLKVSRQPGGDPEIFHSLQGEGVTQGTPSVFLRLALCNLTCTWCDTRYTWDWQSFDFDKETVEMTLEQVEERLLRFGCPHLVITGGEPLMQQKGLALLVTSLMERDFYIEVETNGTIIPNSQLIEGISQWNVSPKLANSGNAPLQRELPHVLGFFARQPSAYFKFVIAEPPDLDEVCDLVNRHHLPRERVFLMPEGRTPEAIEERGRWISQACIAEGFRFSSRLHILLWGDKRGK